MPIIDAARESDLPAIKALLERSGLAAADITPHLANFTVAREGDQLVGVIGLEVHGALGLLRSLAVDEEHRGNGLAMRLYATALGVARRLRIEQLYCLTTTARGFFDMLGWRALVRDDVPEVIRATTEFTTLSAAGAICLVRGMPTD